MITKKGKVNKLKFNPLIFDHSLVKDGLEAVSYLNGKEPYYLVGGMAAQSYLPSLCRRPTSDIDFAIVRPLNYRDFKEMVHPLEESLLDKGYFINFKKKSHSFCLEALNKSGNNLLIEFSRRNKKNFNNSKKRLERELEHSKKKIIEERGATYVVVNTEDIIIPKFVRCLGSLDRHPEFIEDLPSNIPLSKEIIKGRLSLINNLREKSMGNCYDLVLFEKLRFLSDIYDIRVLSELAGINSLYFKEVSKDWTSINNHPKEKSFLEQYLPIL